MPRSSRHKSSHKEAKHSSRDNREPSESEEDARTMKSSVRVSRDSASSEKRKLSSSKVSSGYSNGDVSEDYVVSKRRKEKSDVSAASDRWNGGEDEVCDVVTVDNEIIKGEVLKIEAVKSVKSKAVVDLKSKSSRRNDSGNEKKLEDVGLVVEKEESIKTSSRVESKRKPEKDTTRKEVHDDKDSKESTKDSKEKERSMGRERKVQDSRHESETRAVEGEVGSKDLGEERKGKRSRENTELAAQGEIQNPELEKELGKRTRRRRDDSDDRDKDTKDKDKSQEDVKESEDIRLSCKSERTKDGRYKDVKHGEKHREVVEDVKESEDIRLSSKAERAKDGRYKDVKHGEKPREDVEDLKESEDIRLSSKGERTKDGRYKDVKHGEKHREDVGKDTGRDYKYREDFERYGRHRDVKYREDGERNIKSKVDKYHENGERDDKYKEDKYREDGDRVNRHRGDKHHEDGDTAYRHRGDRYREDGDRRDRRRDDGDRDDRHIDDQYLEDVNRDGRNKEDKNWEEVGRHRDEKPRNDVGKEKSLQDGKYRDERSSRDLTSDKEEKNRDEVDRDGRHRDEKPRNDVDKDKRLQDAKYRDERSSRDLTSDKEEKNWEELGRDGRRRDEKPRNDVDKDKRLQDAKYRDERSSRDLASDKPDIKSLRDESNATESHYRKSNNRDASPIYDDRRSRYNDDRGRRRTGDKEDHNDMRSRSTKEQYSDAAKFPMSSARTESMGDRGRSKALNSDIEMNPSRRRSSPGAGPHSVKDQYRNSKGEDSKSRDYASEERYRHYTTSRKDLSGSTRPIEKSFQKDDSHLRELPERRAKGDSRRSPLHVVDHSPSSTSAERRLLNRSDVKRNLDIDKSGQRDGGSKDGRDYSSREGKGSREFPGDEFSQPDGDTISVSSPFSRPGHPSGNSRSFLLPAPPFRKGADSFEEDNRGKLNNRYRRNGDPNMGRLQGNAWRGVPNWPSPVANGFLPFQHGPPPVGFHPMMQPFPNPMFGVRPSMELNPPGFPYHVNDGDRYSGHGRPLGWRDDSCGPPIHGWDANNSGFRDESHNYARSNWDHKRSLSGGDTWMGQNKGGTELPSALQEDEYSSLRGAGEPWTAQSDMKDQSDKKQLDDNIDIDQSGELCQRNNLESSEIVPDEAADLLRKEYACPSHVYLSMLDISEDLTQPDLFSQFTSRMGMDEKAGCEDDDSKLFLVEEFIDPALKNSYKTSSASLFPPINDSISQKAMSLYKKQRDEIRICREDDPLSKGKNLQVSAHDGAPGSHDDKFVGMLAAGDQTEGEEGALPTSDAVKMEISPGKIDEPVEGSGSSAIAALGEVKMESSDDMVIDKPSYAESLEKSALLSPGGIIGACDPKHENSVVVVVDNQEQKLNDDEAKFGSVVFSGVSSSSSSSMACEAVMPPELIEPGSVNLSRIHPSPESTH